jgi:uncharacterized protein YdeI (YjbR/CyaY-like superfamily)
MAKTKHRADAAEQIDAYIKGLPAWSKKICEKLRNIVIKSDPAIIEDWKWGPNYYYEGMVCGFAAHQKFVNFVFFQGTLLKDKKKILIGNENSVHNRHIKFTDVKEINEDVLLAYIIEAIDNNKKGNKKLSVKDKTVIIPADIKKMFSQFSVLANFEGTTYSRRKEIILYISAAKKDETRQRRIDKAIEVLKKKTGLFDKYKK